MTAVAEILVDSVADVVTVPLHAVVEHEDQTYVVVRDDVDGMEPRPVDLGQSSETRVSIKNGLEEGESIAVNAQDFVEKLFQNRDSSSLPRRFLSWFGGLLLSWPSGIFCSTKCGAF